MNNSYKFSYDIVKNALDDWICEQCVINPNFNVKIQENEKKIFGKNLNYVFDFTFTLPPNLSNCFTSFKNLIITQNCVKILTYKGLDYPDLISEGNPPHSIGIIPLETFMYYPLNGLKFYESLFNLSYIVFNFFTLDRINQLSQKYKGQTLTLKEASKRSEYAKFKNILFDELITYLKNNDPNFILPNSYSGITN
jgi:hypothetical protein